jgi:hypothetical protein
MGVRKINMGQYMATSQERKHMRWCINNEIKISPTAFSTYEWYIDIEINNKKNRSPQVYTKKDLWEQIFNYYKYYYNKYAK